MKKIRGGITAPKGFLAYGLHCGLKTKRKDLGLLYSESPAKAAAVFTTNKVKAAPVIISQDILKNKTEKQAILVNSGNANACTGKKGLADAKILLKKAAEILAIKDNQILVASTGPIGKPLPVNKIKKALIPLASGLSSKGYREFAESILTTDLVVKQAAVTVDLGGKKVTIGGAAKGSGMICPSMATMLAFITSDVNLSIDCLKKSLKNSVDNSFNKITVDGDRSTNDTVFFLANGLAGNKTLTLDSKDYKKFKKALDFITLKLAKDIVKDGEGATKFVEIVVKGAKNNSEAKKAAYSIANSPLVKTAFFGENPNWGRIMAAIGYAGVLVKPEKIDISFDKKMIVKNGVKTALKFKDVLRKKEFLVTVDLKIGQGADYVWTSDFSYDYVKINI